MSTVNWKRPRGRKGNRVKDVRHAAAALRLALERLEQTCRCGEQGKLRELWRNWSMVMGDELSLLALPLGQRSGILLVGAEDHLVMQELSFCTPEILERVNAFMDTPFFHKVELHLHMGEEVLDQPAQITSSTYERPQPQRPAGLDGTFAHTRNLNPDSPVVRSYAAYLKLHGLA